MQPDFSLNNDSYIFMALLEGNVILLKRNADTHFLGSDLLCFMFHDPGSWNILIPAANAKRVKQGLAGIFI